MNLLFPSRCVVGHGFRVRLPHRHRQESALSLIELLAVVAIISILGVIGISAFRSGGKSAAVSTSSSVVGSAISSARQFAITQNCRTRFFIVTDSQGEPDWKLKRYGVLRVPKDTTDIDYSDASIEFELAAKPVDLPSGIYFRDDEHKENENVSAPRSMFDTTYSAKIGDERVEYACIEFLPSGGTAKPSTENIFEITQAPDADNDISDNKNYIRMGVAQSTGRVKYERPSAE